MGKSKSKAHPRSKSLDELVEFFETHDMGEYWDQMPEAHFDIEIKKRTHLIAIDGEIADKLTEIAKSKKSPPRLSSILGLEKRLERRARRLNSGVRPCDNRAEELDDDFFSTD